jgi:hypothetical protein
MQRGGWTLRKINPTPKKIVRFSVWAHLVQHGTRLHVTLLEPNLRVMSLELGPDFLFDVSDWMDGRGRDG